MCVEIGLENKKVVFKLFYFLCNILLFIKKFSDITKGFEMLKKIMYTLSYNKPVRM